MQPGARAMRGACARQTAALTRVDAPQTFDWHSIVLFYSHRVSGQPGGITRLLACSEEQLKSYQGLDIGPTFVHPDHRNHNGMNYGGRSSARTAAIPGCVARSSALTAPPRARAAAYNKPASVDYWLKSGKVPPDVEFIMQLDADMLINRPVIPSALGLSRGTVLSAPYDYLVGTHSGLAHHFGA